MVQNEHGRCVLLNINGVEKKNSGRDQRTMKRSVMYIITRIKSNNADRTDQGQGHFTICEAKYDEMFHGEMAIVGPNITQVRAQVSGGYLEG